MAAPFPYEAVSGAVLDAAEGEAMALYRQFAWVARLSDEMNTEAELDLKRTMQLVFHARSLRRFHEMLQARINSTHTPAQIADVIEGVFAAKKCRWASRSAMNADLAALYTNSGALADWIEANAADYKQGYSVNKEISPGVMTDEPIKVSKPSGLASRLTDFRALFSATAAADLSKR